MITKSYNKSNYLSNFCWFFQIQTDYFYDYKTSTFFACIKRKVKTHRITGPSIRQTWSLLVDTNHFSHVFKTWITGNNIIKWWFVVFHYSVTNGPSTNFPQYETERVDVCSPEWLKDVHSNAKMKHNMIEVFG